MNIPEYQRPYRWQTKHLKRLLCDLAEHFSPHPQPDGPSHDFYLGSIILHQAREPRGRKDQLNIIDGQQRLISMALLAHLLGEHVLANGVSLSSPESQARASHNLFWLKQQILPKIDFSRVNITLVVTRREDDAYRFFETQNTGGVRLDGAAILKAHHLRMVPQDEQNTHARRWEAWGELSQVLDAVMKSRHWQTLKWRGLSSHRQPVQAREEIVTEFADCTGRGADVAYRTVSISHFLGENTQHMASQGYAMRQPLNDGANTIHYFDYFQQLRRSVLLSRNDSSLVPFHQFYDALVVKANGSEFLRKLFDCTVLLYVSQFGRQHLLEAGYWLFRVVFAPRLINEKAVRESSAQSFVKDHPMLDWIAASFTHDELMVTLKNFRYSVANRLDSNSVKYRFVRSVQGYFSMPLVESGDTLSDAFDDEFRNAISRKLEVFPMNKAAVQ
nr:MULTISPECIES: DUF262 domain-containing protein [unclassified Pseudomonas]